MKNAPKSRHVARNIVSPKQAADVLLLDTIHMAQRIPALASAPPKALHGLLGRAERFELHPNQPLFRKGDHVQWIYVIEEGLVRSYHSSITTEVTIGWHKAPCLFAFEDALTRQSTRQCNAKALLLSRGCRIDVDTFYDWLNDHTNVVLDLAAAVAEQVQRLQEDRRRFFFSVKQRLAALLLDYAEIAGRKHPLGIQIRVPLQQEDLARDLAVAVKSVSRSLKELASMGVIAQSKGWYIVCDHHRLKEICHC